MSKKWPDQPLISIVTPLYNTPSNLLIECVESALFQSYQQWELILVDDASNDRSTLNCLSRIARIKDPRIKVLTNRKNRGTCQSTNRGVRRASGEYIAFLDHDDRITPNALFETARTISGHDRPDLIYSDRDLISPSGKRHDRISKPAWSPETLLSGNYLFHLMVAKRSLFLELGGYRKDFEGSQDLDFVLRLAEVTHRVVHIPKVLYNFRQAETSCAYDMEAKSFIFEKGVKAVQDALDRRGINGKAYELEHAWRGNYGIRLKNRLAHDTIIYNRHPNLAEFLNHRIKSSGKAYFLIKREGIQGEEEETDSTLVSFFQIPGIGCITGKIVSNNKIVHAGLINRPEGIPLGLYMDFPSETPGLLASASIMRNTSLTHPWCCAISKEIWEALGGFDNAYGGIYTLFDFAMGCLEKGYRNLFVPQTQYRTEKRKQTDIYPEDVRLYKKKWQKRLNTNDPHYNQNLSLNHCDMRLRTPH
ncbi:glycosyltransferase [Desulforapulum autotrophicum]|uniref:glycosyltransferase n=1 Tax=Desulforapulum autotrophicum TaxID=2296 RepID=UPI0002E97B16|nr:glycosyltransferase [Desulforapulum autotrophicum]